MKRTLALLLALVMVFSLCACGSGSTSSSTTSTSAAATETSDSTYDTYAAKYGTVDGTYKSITVASKMDIANLQPTAGTGIPKNEFYWNVYESLFDLGENNELYADLAKGFEAAPDGSYWDIFLFSDIKDSAGNAITAEDCVASFDWLINAGEALKFEDVKSYEAVDELTFRIYWNHAPESTDDFEFPLVRTYIFDSQYQGSDFSTQPVGTGNYIVADFVTGNHLTIWANPNYWAYSSTEDLSGRRNLHSANVQMITFEIISESSTAVIALQNGTIDLCDYISQADTIQKFKDEYADQYVVDDSRVAAEYVFMEPNMDSSNPLSSDENLRLAIYYGLSNDMIASLMGTSYVGMKTLGHRGFSDFDTSWEEEANYANTYDMDLAKDYLAKSNYDGRTLKIVCQPSESLKNASQAILAQLTAIGINCEMETIDSAIFTSKTSDPANWDLMVFQMGGTSLVGSLSLPLGQPNTNEGGTAGVDGWSLNFIRDNDLYEILQDAKANDDTEHVKTLIDYALGHAYIYPMAYEFTCYIYSKDITSLYFRESTLTPAACTFSGQTQKEETAQSVGSVSGSSSTAASGIDPALVGTYTYSEAPKFGDGTNNFTLTLNADGTYELVNECNGETCSATSTWSVNEKGQVVCAPGAVSGDKDRMLVDWVSDFSNVDPVFVVNPADGTMTPVVSADPADYAGTYTYSEAGTFGSKDNDFTLTLNADGTYLLECNNSVGENISTSGTFTVDGDGNASLSASPVSGDMDKLLNAGWADEDNPAPTFTLNKDNGTMVPAGWEAAETAEEGAEETPAEGEAAEGAATEEAATEEPGIVTGLKGNGFECFTYTEESDFGTFVWYVLKSDGMVIVVTPNPNLGTEDGLGVWHFTEFTEDKGLMTLSGIEEADKSLPQIGSMWADKDNYVMAWQITGQDTVQPAGAAE